jgi:hypothetical protein
MKRFLIFSVLVSAFSVLNCQLPPGSWSDHLSYSRAEKIAVGKEEVFASTGSAIIVYNKEFNEVKKMSKVNGLTETGIECIGWSEENKVLVIGYKDSNIDLVKNNLVYNLPDIINRYLAVEKRINKIITSGKFAYLATSFGLVIVDLVKEEIYDTWRPGPDTDNNEVYDVAIGNNVIYAATEKGIWFADPAIQGLSFFGNWEQINSLPDPDSRCTLIILRGSRLFVNVSESYSGGDSIYELDGKANLISFIPGVTNRSFDPAPEGFIVSSAESLRYIYDNGSVNDIQTNYGWGDPDISQAVIESDRLWIADLSFGLVLGTGISGYTILSPTGPASNFVANISNEGGKTIICSGGTDNFTFGDGRIFQVSVFEDNMFTNIIEDRYQDAVRSVIDPSDPGHFFVSSWGKGLFEFRNNILTKHFDENNTPEMAADAGTGGVRICGLAIDANRNLWITQTGSTGSSIKILQEDGNWTTSFTNNNIRVMGDIFSARSGQKWITLPGTSGLFVIDDNNTPSIFSDDRYKILIIKDMDGSIIQHAYSVTEDLDGNIWVGTDQGPLIYFNPEKLFETDLRASRIKIPRNDGSGFADYLLGNETITSIKVDGANRKWLGTGGSGAYMVSEDGTAVLKNYNSTNSPLFSDSIASVAIDGISGEVWLGTSLGVISVREVATAGAEDFRNVYAFPNPVRRDFTGNVTITGLMKESRIKVTDVSGNLVYDTVSEGGQAQWDLTTYNGERVTSGVYLVFCSGNDGSKGIITKILVIGR